MDYLPPVKPSAIALGTLFNHAANMAVLTPLFGETYHKAQNASSKEEFIKSKEAASAAALYGSTLVGSGLQTYAVAAVLNHCNVLSYKGAAYIGGLVFAATSVPQVWNCPSLPGIDYRMLTANTALEPGLPGAPSR